MNLLFLKNCMLLLSLPTEMGIGTCQSISLHTILCHCLDFDLRHISLVKHHQSTILKNDSFRKHLFKFLTLGRSVISPTEMKILLTKVKCQSVNNYFHHDMCFFHLQQWQQTPQIASIISIY